MVVPSQQVQIVKHVVPDDLTSKEEKHPERPMSPALPKPPLMDDVDLFCLAGKSISTTITENTIHHLIHLKTVPNAPTESVKGKHESRGRSRSRSRTRDNTSTSHAVPTVSDDVPLSTPVQCEPSSAVPTVESYVSQIQQVLQQNMALKEKAAKSSIADIFPWRNKLQNVEQAMPPRPSATFRRKSTTSQLQHQQEDAPKDCGLCWPANGVDTCHTVQPAATMPAAEQRLRESCSAASIRSGEEIGNAKSPRANHASLLRRKSYEDRFGLSTVSLNDKANGVQSASMRRSSSIGRSSMKHKNVDTPVVAKEDIVDVRPARCPYCQSLRGEGKCCPDAVSKKTILALEGQQAPTTETVCVVKVCSFKRCAGSAIP